MRFLLLIAVLCSTALSTAQKAYYIPDNVSSTGNCNVYPMGQSYMRYQTIVMAQDLGSAAAVIADLGFANCYTGTRSFSQITIKMDHTASGSLSSTFASNLTPNAVTVLNASNFSWAMVQHAWTKVGLTTPFAFNGTDNLVIEIDVTGGAGTSGGCHRATRQRVYSRVVGSLTGTNGNAALKMEITTSSGAWVFGRGCPGSNGDPTLSFTGNPLLGKTLDVHLTNGPILSPALMNFGFTNTAPYPFDLSVIGAPGCSIYTDAFSGVITATDASGVAVIGLPVPNDPNLVGLQFFLQWICIDPGANAASLTTSNAGGVRIGA